MRKSNYKLPFLPSPHCDLSSRRAKDNLHPLGPNSAAPCRKSPFVYRLWRFCASRTPSAIPRTPAPWSCPACSVRFSFPCRISTGGQDPLRSVGFSFANCPSPEKLACWASAGYNAAGCAAIETQLRQCMDGPKPQPASPNTINHHMGRLGKHITYDGKPT